MVVAASRPAPEALNGARWSRPNGRGASAIARLVSSRSIGIASVGGRRAAVDRAGLEQGPAHGEEPGIQHHDVGFGQVLDSMSLRRLTVARYAPAGRGRTETL